MRALTIHHLIPDDSGKPVIVKIRIELVKPVDEYQSLHSSILGVVERELLSLVYQETKYNQYGGSKRLGISRETYRRKLKHYGLMKTQGEIERLLKKESK